MTWQARLVPGARVHGLDGDGPVELLEVRIVGTQAFLTWRDDFGVRGSQLIGEAGLASLEVDSDDEVALDADPDLFRLAADALRLTRAHQLNPLLALTSANVEPLPHQVQAVYEHLLARHPQRFLLADDPGAGKTVMAGLFLREAMARGWVRRVLIVVPGSLTEQWHEELLEKFGLRFEVFDPAVHTGDRAFDELPQLVVRLDQLSRNDRLRARLAEATYDLAIVDEAHKLSARHWGSKVLKSKRFELGEELRDQVPSLLLMTATPHNGKEPDFRLFLSLLDEQLAQSANLDVGAAGLMRRLVKEQLVHADGTALFPPRRASTVTYRLSALEADLYEDVTEYVREEMNKVTGEETRTVGFALLVLQRRLASSPAAILQSLTRRRDRLEGGAERMRAADDRLSRALAASLSLRAADAEDDWAPTEQTAWEDEASSVATTARTLEELEVEVAILERLVAKAESVRAADVDAKWEALAGLLRSEEMYDDERRRRKIIIFTEHRDTLDYLEERLGRLLGPEVAVEVIHGATSRPDRRLAQVRFTQEAASSVLLATDAAGEGVNLQVAHLMVNYDIPWNPNRLEQRFGRIHRIGQHHTCHLWNLVAVDTREGDVFVRLLEKLEVQREALGDRVFDVLGDVLTDASLTQLLTQAIRGDTTVAEAAGARLETGLREAVAARERTVSTLSSEDLRRLRTAMARATARSLQPSVVQDFTSASLARLHGDLAPVGPLWTARHVPARVRDLDPGTVLPRYDALTFERVTDGVPRAVTPELVSPGHPLLDALTRIVLADHGKLLRRGGVLEDDRTDESYVLVSVATDNRLVTLAVTSESAVPADPAGFADLPSRGAASAAEIDQVRSVLDRLPALVSLDAEVLAVALVRGTAGPGEGARRRTALAAARADLASRGEVVVAPLLIGWDLEVETTQGVEFVRVTDSAHAPRRQEELARANLGEAYVDRSVTPS